jgi:hypothetical protein
MTHAVGYPVDSPLSARRVNGSLGVGDGSFREFPAELLAAQTAGGRPCWSWREATFGPFGTFSPLEGGRSGDASACPAFEVQNAFAGVGDIVWLRPGWSDVTHGQEWLFRCDCAKGGATEYADTSCCGGRIAAVVSLVVTEVIPGEFPGYWTLLDAGDEFLLTYQDGLFGWSGDSELYETGDVVPEGLPLAGQPLQVRFNWRMLCLADAGNTNIVFPMFVTVGVTFYVQGEYYPDIAAGGIAETIDYPTIGCDPFNAGHEMGISVDGEPYHRLTVAIGNA